MSIGPETVFSSLVSETMEVVEAGLASKVNKEARERALGAAWSIASDSIALARAVSDYLYLLENDSPDSERLARALHVLRTRRDYPPNLTADAHVRTSTTASAWSTVMA